MLVCDKCGAGITEGAKFCAQCGDPVTEADKVTVPASNPSVANVQITFGQSSSPNHAKAVAICQNIPSYNTMGEDKKIQHVVALPITEIELLVNLYDLVGSWKSSQMLINGHAASKKDLTYYGVGCFRNRQKSFKPEQFCFGEREYEANIWGCKRLNMPINEWGGGWLEYGKFDKTGVWHFDKPRIKHELEMGLKENELCPVLDRRKVLETLDKLPDTVNSKTDKNWQYRTSYEEIQGEYKKVAVGIRPVIKKINRYVIGDYKPYWEPEDSENTGKAERIIQVNIDRSSGTTSSHARSPTKKSFGAFFWVWVAVAVVVVLYLLA